LNFDEAFVAWLSALRGAEKVYVISVDLLHPPLWYYLQGTWIALTGNSELSLRLLPGLFNVLMVPLVAQFARLAGNRSVGQFAAWLWAVLPVPILHAHYARQHSLAVLFAALSAWCLVQTLCTRRLRWLVAMGLFNVLGVYTIYAHFFVVFLEGLVLVLYLRRAPRLFWIGGVVQVASVASLWPWYRVISNTDQTILHVGYVPPLSAVRLVEFMRDFALWQWVPAWLLLAWLPLVIATLRLAWRNPWVNERNRPAWQILVAMGCGMPILYLVISLRHSLLEMRYLFPMYWAAVVLWAAGWSAISRRVWRYVTIGLFAASVCVSLVGIYARPLLERDDWRAAGAYLTEQVQPDSAMLFRGGQGYHPVIYYYRGLPVTYVDFAPTDGVAQFPQADKQGRAFKMLWVVFYLVKTHADVPQQFLPSADSPWRIAVEQAFPGVYLIEYVRTPGD
jgi:4-amino-4-deoxy-L-arabinose transferase-like glycosyltransferase